VGTSGHLTSRLANLAGREQQDRAQGSRGSSKAGQCTS
jgi:hypothetical protein